MKNLFKISLIFITTITVNFAFAQNGKHLKLDGVSAFAEILDHNDLDIDPSEAFTITCWVKSDNTSSNFRFIDKKNAGNAGYELATASGTGGFWAHNKNSANQVVTPSAGGASISDGNWHHLAYVLNISDKTSKTYIDGFLDETFSHVLIGVYGSANSENLYLGKDLIENTFYDGDLDEIRFWSYEMTPTDIMADMNDASLTGAETNLIASWDFENATGNSVPDISGNGHTATMYGGAYTFDPDHDQTITFNPITYKYTTDAPFTVSAQASTGLDITYSIVSGPAVIADSTITLTGLSDTVVVKAEQLGDATYNPVSTTQSFYVLDLNSIYPEVKVNDFFSRKDKNDALVCGRIAKNKNILSPN